MPDFSTSTPKIELTVKQTSGQGRKVTTFELTSRGSKSFVSEITSAHSTIDADIGTELTAKTP